MKGRNVPQRLPRSLVGWIAPTCKFTEAELVRLGGTDAAMYLRVQHFGKPQFASLRCTVLTVCAIVCRAPSQTHLNNAAGWQLFLFCTLWCCIILIPIHVTRVSLSALQPADNCSVGCLLCNQPMPLLLCFATSAKHLCRTVSATLCIFAGILCTARNQYR